jgi:aryl-alcohol dehydrogenase-like predicted oxidoreductase
MTNPNQRLNGRATVEATGKQVQAFSELDYRPFGRTGLLVSAVGFGGYRVDATTPPFEEALEHALRQGINLVDTSTNYGDGGSELLVGRVAQRLHNEGVLPREAVVIVSKAGYLQGQNYQESQRRKQAGQPWPELVPYGQGLEHCIHPEFLEAQLSQSLSRLQLQTLDVYLLHNPEYYLNWAQNQGLDLEEARQTYYERIERAFVHLEQEVRRGRLAYYGISSNTFPTPATDPAHTSLARVWEIAESVSARHHFRVIQLPANLLETGAFVERNQPGGETVLAFARQKQLAVLINRPLNAIQGNQLTRLADVRSSEPFPEDIAADELPAHAGQAIADLVAVERRFSSDIRPLLDVERSALAQLADIFSIGRLLQTQWQGFGTYQNWIDIRARHIVPQVQSAVQYLTNQPQLPAQVDEWLESYISTLNETLLLISAAYAVGAREQLAQIRKRATAAEAAWAEAPTMSQLAIRALRSTAGVSSVLVGMRRKGYVDDVLAELRREVSVEPRPADWEQLAG